MAFLDSRNATKWESRILELQYVRQRGGVSITCKIATDLMMDCMEKVLYVLIPWFALNVAGFVGEACCVSLIHVEKKNSEGGLLHVYTGVIVKISYTITSKVLNMCVQPAIFLVMSPGRRTVSNTRVDTSSFAEVAYVRKEWGSLLIQQSRN